jgi:glutamate-ammonia-ligase adenylyltransferase
MVRDEQTHLLPETEADLKRIAFMMGFAIRRAFPNGWSRCFRTVERRYARCSSRRPSSRPRPATSSSPARTTIRIRWNTLKKLGFERPSDISRVIRTWHYGRYRATQSVEARERLTELTPELLRVFGESKRADEAILRFDSFISGLPAGIQLFSLLGSNPALLSLIVNIMSAAPKLAEVIAASRMCSTACSIPA